MRGSDKHAVEMCPSKNGRDLNVEVLRCFLMLVIVIYHGCNNGPFCVSGENHDVKFGALILSWATNSFIFISGWYGIRFSWDRVLRFALMGVFASVVMFLLSPIAFDNWRFAFSLGWFGNAYLALMFLAPLVNAGLEALVVRSSKALVRAWMAYSVAMFISWLPLSVVGIDLGVPGWTGHSFNTMLYIYVSAFVLRRTAWFSRLGRGYSLALFLVALCLHVSQIGLSVRFACVRSVLAHASDYNSPAMLICGAMAFVFFIRTRFAPLVQKLCGVLAPSMFVVYLLHTGCMGGGRILVNRMLVNLDTALICIPLHRVFTVVLGGLAIFLVCVAIDSVRRYGLARISRL